MAKTLLFRRIQAESTSPSNFYEDALAVAIELMESVMLDIVLDDEWKRLKLDLLDPLVREG